MPRDARAYLFDIAAACRAIAAAAEGLTLEDYRRDRLVRSAIEREFIIGEAISALARVAPHVFASIPNARRIVDFRNLLTHEYPAVDDAVVWSLATDEAPALLLASEQLLEH